MKLFVFISYHFFFFKCIDRHSLSFIVVTVRKIDKWLHTFGIGIGLKQIKSKQNAATLICQRCQLWIHAYHWNDVSTVVVIELFFFIRIVHYYYPALSFYSRWENLSRFWYTDFMGWEGGGWDGTVKTECRREYSLEWNFFQWFIQNSESTE